MIWYCIYKIVSVSLSVFQSLYYIHLKNDIRHNEPATLNFCGPDQDHTDILTFDVEIRTDLRDGGADQDPGPELIIRFIPRVNFYIIEKKPCVEIRLIKKIKRGMTI